MVITDLPAVELSVLASTVGGGGASRSKRPKPRYFSGGLELEGASPVGSIALPLTSQSSLASCCGQSTLHTAAQSTHINTGVHHNCTKLSIAQLHKLTSFTLDGCLKIKFSITKVLNFCPEILIVAYRKACAC
jgi:hypothetical protein